MNVYFNLKSLKLYILVGYIFFTGRVQAQKTLEIDNTSFEMEIENNGLFLLFKNDRIELANGKDWHFKISPKIVVTEIDTFEMPSINEWPKANAVKALKLSKNQYLLLSSFYTAPSDARIALGVDILITYNTKSQNFSPVSSEFLKSRIGRGWGPCRNAMNYTYLIQDIDNDGLIDLGVLKEQITCDFENDMPSKPYYRQEAIKWYLNKSNSAYKPWILDPRYEGKLPEYYTQLKSLSTGPVDVVGRNLWKTNNRLEWPSNMPEGSIVIMKKQ